MFTRLAIAAVWLLHFLPLPVLALFGRSLGLLVYALAAERRDITLRNLRLCFPQMPDRQRRRIARRHFQALGRALLEHGILWWSSRERIQRLVRIEGREHFEAVRDRPVIWLAPHFVGLDMGGIRLTTEYQLTSIYTRQKDPVFNALLLHGRSRFCDPVLCSRQDGVRPIVQALRKGIPLYYLPDMDFGRRESIFVPFFGVPAATVTGVPRLARATGAAVLPCITRQLPGGRGYVLRFYPAWEDYPTSDVKADTRRMNQFIEERVAEMPEQYFWLHKRFKTRPPGEAGVYRR